jgi:hypothetical protein
LLGLLTYICFATNQYKKMNIAPFTEEYAVQLAAKFQHIVHTKYQDQNDSLYVVFYVLHFPYSENIKREFERLYTKELNENEDYTAPEAFNYIMQYSGNEFDVVIVSATNTEIGIKAAVLPIQLISQGEDLKYGFNLDFYQTS